MRTSFRSAEMNLLHQSARLDDPDDAIKEAERIIGSGRIKWDDLYIMADFHCIKPQVTSMLKKLPDGFVPEGVSNRFSEAGRNNIFQQLQNAGEFLKVKHLLDEAGIKAVPFKGFWFDYDLYGNLGNRESSDIDVFIDIKDLERIKPVMHSAGYQTQGTLLELTDEYIRNELAEYNFNKYDGEARLAHVEFHWRIGLRAYRMNINMSDLESQIKNSVFQNRELEVFSPSANLLLAVMHHGGKDRYIKIKDIIDIALLIRKYRNDTDWNWLLSKAKEFNVSTLVFLGARLASILTGIEIPSEIREKTFSAGTGKLAEKCLIRMELPPARWFSFNDEMNGWFFKIRTRDGLKIKSWLSYYTIRKIILPHLVPLRWRYLFFNRKIKVKPV